METREHLPYRVVTRTNEIILEKDLIQHPAHYKCSINVIISLTNLSKKDSEAETFRKENLLEKKCKGVQLQNNQLAK